MERRKFLLGAGSTAIGASAIVGSGAFSEFEADRDMSIGVVDDTDGYVQLIPGELDGSHSEPIVDIDGDGKLYISIDNLNPQARTRFNDVFRVRNADGNVRSADVDDEDVKEAYDGSDHQMSLVLEYEDLREWVTLYLRASSGNEESGDDGRVSGGTFTPGTQYHVDLEIDTGHDDDVEDLVSGDEEEGFIRVGIDRSGAP